LAEHGENEMFDKDGHVRLEVVPHGFWLDALVHESQSVGKAGLAEPDSLADPFFDLL